MYKMVADLRRLTAVVHLKSSTRRLKQQDLRGVEPTEYTVTQRRCNLTSTRLRTCGGTTCQPLRLVSFSVRRLRSHGCCVRGPSCRHRQTQTSTPRTRTHIRRSTYHPPNPGQARATSPRRATSPQAAARTTLSAPSTRHPHTQSASPPPLPPLPLSSGGASMDGRSPRGGPPRAGGACAPAARARSRARVRRVSACLLAGMRPGLGSTPGCPWGL